MRYGFFAYDIRKTGINDVGVEQIGFIEVNHTLGKDEVFTRRLRPWALDVLRTGRHEAGLYTFTYAEVDQDGEEGRPIAAVEIGWTGTAEVVPIPQ